MIFTAVAKHVSFAINKLTIIDKVGKNMSDIQEGSINAARLFEALGKIGYSPTSAVLDILDNSISAEATKVHITIKPIEVKTTNPSATRLQIDKITIADNGQGMSTQGLHNALSIGSSSENYTSDTLSKFGIIKFRQKTHYCIAFEERTYNGRNCGPRFVER